MANETKIDEVVAEIPIVSPWHLINPEIAPAERDLAGALQ